MGSKNKIKPGDDPADKTKVRAVYLSFPFMYMFVFIHSYIHTYIHTYIYQIDIHTYMHTYMHRCVSTLNRLSDALSTNHLRNYHKVNFKYTYIHIHTYLL